MSNKPVYKSELTIHDGVQLLRIWDLHSDSQPTMTVTNGAEIVLSELQYKLGALPALIIYKDSSGNWDRMVWDGRFAAFRSIAPGMSATGDDELAMAAAVKAYRAERGMADSAVAEYNAYIERLNANGIALASFQCPACEHEMLTQATDHGEQWDSLSICPYCGSIFLKITRGDKVEARLP